MTFPLASYGKLVAVTGSLGLDRFIVVFRPVMTAELGALNMSTRSWTFREPPRRILRAMARSSTFEKQPRR